MLQIPGLWLGDLTIDRPGGCSYWNPQGSNSAADFSTVLNLVTRYLQLCSISGAALSLLRMCTLLGRIYYSKRAHTSINCRTLFGKLSGLRGSCSEDFLQLHRPCAQSGGARAQRNLFSSPMSNYQASHPSIESFSPELNSIDSLVGQGEIDGQFSVNFVTGSSKTITTNAPPSMGTFGGDILTKTCNDAAKGYVAVLH